jgi:hypothetical protein
MGCQINLYLARAREMSDNAQRQPHCAAAERLAGTHPRVSVPVRTGFECFCSPRSRPPSDTSDKALSETSELSLHQVQHRHHTTFASDISDAVCQICQTVGRWPPLLAAPLAAFRAEAKPFNQNTIPPSRPRPAGPSRREQQVLRWFHGSMVRDTAGSCLTRVVTYAGNSGKCRKGDDPAAGTIRPHYPHETSQVLKTSKGRTS